MKFKLDENLGSRAAHLFTEYGYYVETVRHENLGGAPDQIIFDACVREQSCLVTLDLDFADVVRFPSEKVAGIVILRPPKSASMNMLATLVRALLVALKTESIGSNLWIVEPGRIRVRETSEPQN
jgi:predicted nuclease of predicted toxin-antitoxin system